MLRFRARHLVLGARDLVLPGFNGRLVDLQQRFQFRNFENRHHLVFVDVAAIVHAERFHIARFFGINVDLLKRHQFGADSEVLGHRPRLRLHEPNRHSVGCGQRFGRDVRVATRHQ